MNFKNYKIIPNKETGKTTLNLASLSEIKDCETKLNVKFHKEYIEYVTKFGEGVLGGTFIRIYIPKRILEDIAEWKNRITEYWFWDLGKDVLTKEQVLNAVIIGDTLSGDEIIYYKNEYYLLPRYYEEIYKMGKSLEKAIEWICNNEKLTVPFTDRNFEPMYR